MVARATAPLLPLRACAGLLLILIALIALAGCGAPTAPAPTLKTETFTGTLQPLGSDSKTFIVSYAQGATDLSVSIDSLKTVEASNPVTGITIGVGFGGISGVTCVLQVQTPTATLGQELFAPNGASAGTYCVAIFDCPTGSTGCSSTLTEAVTYSMTVKHY